MKLNKNDIKQVKKENYNNYFENPYNKDVYKDFLFTPFGGNKKYINKTPPPNGLIIFNNGLIIFNNGLTIYNNGLTIFNNGLTIFNNGLTIFNNESTIYKN